MAFSSKSTVQSLPLVPKTTKHLRVRGGFQIQPQGNDRSDRHAGCTASANERRKENMTHVAARLLTQWRRKKIILSSSSFPRMLRPGTLLIVTNTLNEKLTKGEKRKRKMTTNTDRFTRNNLAQIQPPIRGAENPPKYPPHQTTASKSSPKPHPAHRNSTTQLENTPRGRSKHTQSCAQNRSKEKKKITSKPQLSNSHPFLTSDGGQAKTTQATAVDATATLLNCESKP